MKRYFSLILAIAATVSAQIVPSTGNVRGPTSATDNAVARYDGTTGKLIQNSGITIDDSGNLTVSGTGTSSVAGGLTLLSSKLAFADDGTNINATATSRRLQLIATGSSIVTGYNTDFYFSNETSVAKYNGNLLIGTTTDGGQKLQVSGTVAMSGTSFTQDWGSTGANRGIIKLGQHTTLSNIAAVSLNGDTSDAGLSGLFGGGQNNTYIQAPASGSVIVRTNGSTTALTLDSSQRTIAEKTVTSKNGIFSGIKSVAVAALNTAYAITTAAAQGIVVIRDDTTGGSALWLIDPNQGSIQISSNLPKTITLTYSGGVWNITQTAGSVTTNYSFAFLVPSNNLLD